jgi:hypothetical protein
MLRESAFEADPLAHDVMSVCRTLGGDHCVREG